MPNPARGAIVVSIDSKQPGIGRLEIVDLLGRSALVHDLKLAGARSQQHIDIARLAAGAYTIIVDTPSGRVASRLIVH
jgi:hypothetical protein